MEERSRGTTSPLIALVGFMETEIGFAIERGMGFVADVLEDGDVVVCTASHLFKNCRNYNFLNTAPGGVVSLVPRSRRVTIPDPNLDVALITFNPEGISQSIETFKGPFTTPFNRNLWSARNTYDPYGLSPVHTLLTAQVSDGQVDEVLLKIKDGRNQVMPPGSNEGVRHGSVPLQSLPGTSGSPIWDNEWRLLGMNLGTVPGSGRSMYVLATDIAKILEENRISLGLTPVDKTF